MASEESVAIRQSLAGLSKTMSSHMEGISRSTVSFREAATQHNRNLSGIIKDVFSSVAGQRKELSQTNDSIEEAFSGIQQGFRENSRATDSLGASMEKVLSVQYKTLSELSQMNRNFNTLIYNTSGGVLSNIFGGVFGKSWFDNLGTALKAIGLGTALGAPFLADRVGGGGGGGGGLGPVDVGSGSGQGYEKAGATKQQIADYIKEAAAKRGIDPNTAVAVAKSEGLNQYVGDRGSSFGPYQLHYGGLASGGMAGKGEGDNFTAKTGLDARDSSTWKQQIDYALDTAKKNGWGAWHGAARVGISERQGLNVNPTTPGSITNNVTTNNLNPDQGRQALPPGTPNVMGPAGQIQPLSQPTGMNGRFPDSMLQSIGQGHKLQPSAAAAYQQMETAARKDGITWSITDSYRDYNSQVRLAQQKGLYSQGGLAATPGRSNHGWGLAVDLGSGANEKNSKQNQWLQANAARFGFSNIPREPWHWEFRGQGSTPLQGGAPVTPSADSPTSGSGGAEAQQGATVDPRLASGDANQIMSYARETASADISSKMGGMMPMTPMMGAMGSIVPMMGAGGIGGIGGMLGPIMGILGSLGGGQLQQQEFAQQLQPSFNTASNLQAAAVEEKIMPSMQQKSADPEQRETEPSQFTQSIDRHFPQGSFSEYNTDNHLYPEWASLVYDIYGRFTGSKGGNIKTSLA